MVAGLGECWGRVWGNVGSYLGIMSGRVRNSVGRKL